MPGSLRPLHEAHVILASASPRRAELLSQVGIKFKVAPPLHVDETLLPGEPPRQAAQRLAKKKAHLARHAAPDAHLIIAADTLVVLEGAVLGKPTSPSHARAMLHALSGQSHEVVTGYTVIGQYREISAAITTRVWFRPLDSWEIDAYVASGEPLDKAGSYGIQGRAALFVSQLEGDYFNVVGLPLASLAEAIRQCGFRVL